MAGPLGPDVFVHCLFVARSVQGGFGEVVAVGITINANSSARILLCGCEGFPQFAGSMSTRCRFAMSG